ncbi:hypothetical protein [Bremerella cremea]|uniref:hypothetical protein n=1 Tax=Bremerella cremea TaxID=1031537 RepID=UPI0031E8D576
MPLSAEDLIRWRTEHEAWIAAEETIPKLPQIGITTCQGLRLISKLEAIDADHVKLLREQELTFCNPNRVQFHNIQMNMRLPEAVYTYGEPSKKAGTKIIAKPDRTPWTVSSVGSGSVSAGEHAPTPNHVLEIPLLSAEETVRIPFYTFEYFQIMLSPPDEKSLVPAPNPDDVNMGNKLNWYFEGTYQFVLRGEFITADFFVPLRYSFDRRVVTSLPCQSTAERWELFPLMIFPNVTLSG